MIYYFIPKTADHLFIDYHSTRMPSQSQAGVTQQVEGFVDYPTSASKLVSVAHGGGSDHRIRK